MKLIEQSIEVLDEQKTMDDMYKAMETAGRICYQSEPKEGVTSMDFVNKMKALGHGRVLEFGNVYLKLENSKIVRKDKLNNHEIVAEHIYEASLDRGNPFVKANDDFTCITTNYRFIYDLIKRLVNEGVVVDMDTDSFIRSVYEYTDRHPKRIALLWTVSRGVADQFRTHTTLSSLMESTRYNNYSKSKYGCEIKVVKPLWYDDNKINLEDYKDSPECLYKLHMDTMEYHYMDLIRKGLKPEQARGVLGLDIATHFIQCGFIGVGNTGWNKFFHERLSYSAQAEARTISEKACRMIDEKFDINLETNN